MSSKLKNKRNKQRRSRGGRARLASSSFSSSTALSRPIRVVLRGDPLLCSVGAGNSTYTTTSVTFDAITDFASVAETAISTFASFRFIKIVAKITPLGDFDGSTAFGFSEDSAVTSSVSTYALSGRVAIRSNNNKSQGLTRMVWHSASYTDLDFHETSSAMSPPICVFVAYTDNTNFGKSSNGSGSAQVVFRVDFDVTVDLRGLGV